MRTTFIQELQCLYNFKAFFEPVLNARMIRNDQEYQISRFIDTLRKVSFY
jgi:hypothetical protein